MVSSLSGRTLIHHLSSSCHPVSTASFQFSSFCFVLFLFVCLLFSFPSSPELFPLTWLIEYLSLHGLCDPILAFFLESLE